MSLVIHTLKNGATVLPLSLHGFKFSDGTACAGQDPDVVAKFTLQRDVQYIGTLKGMDINSMRMVLTDKQLQDLDAIAAVVDIVILPFPVLVALHDAGVREDFANCVGFNPTLETQRAAPDAKVVDINNWSW
jgi:hypothetical protein